MTDDPEPLPSLMGLVAGGDTRPEIVAGARDEAGALRRQAFDDQILAACLKRFGGDERTASLYWRLGRTVAALSRGSVRFTSVEDAISYLEDHYEGIASED